MTTEQRITDEALRVVEQGRASAAEAVRLARTVLLQHDKIGELQKELRRLHDAVLILDPDVAETLHVARRCEAIAEEFISPGQFKRATEVGP